MRTHYEKTVALVALLAASTVCHGQSADTTRQAEILRSNFDTSSPDIAPPWSLRPWFWEDDVNTSEAVWDLVNGCRDHGLPLGAVLIDAKDQRLWIRLASAQNIRVMLEE